MPTSRGDQSTTLLPTLFKAAKSGNVTILQKLLDPATGGQELSENDLRIALQRASEAGNEQAVKLFLAKGAKTDVITEKGLSPLHRAVEKGHLGVVRLLLDSGVSPETRDQSGRTVYIFAALRGQNEILDLLIEYCADSNAVDNEDRSTLDVLASDTYQPSRFNEATVRTVISTGVDPEKVDKLGRTALQTAAAYGNLVVARALLSGPGKPLANIHAFNDRGKTALHFAAENNHSEMVRLLLRNNALIEAVSDGNWTAFLIAAKRGHAKTVDALLSSEAKVNARTSSGMTALHWAADLGHLDVVKRILREDQAWKNSKDSFDSTPLSRAGQHGHQAIVQELRPYIFEGSLSLDSKEACEKFTAAVVDFYRDAGTLRRNIVKKKSVYETLYALDPNDPSKQRFATTTAVKDIAPSPPDFRWIHLPSNNVAWAEALITKFFLEKGSTDMAGFKAMQPALRMFGQQQHRGPKVHSRFMRPCCQRISDGENLPDLATRPKARNDSMSKIGKARKLSETVDTGKGITSEMVVLFMPYLHWETDFNRGQCTQAVKRMQNMRAHSDGLRTSKSQDENLIRGYLNSSTDLHLRRTLDQFKHHSINTEKRDRDQVVFRYCDKAKKPLKIFMVDQLWMWILDDNLLLTSFPERWGQPKRDPLNLFDGVIEDINSKTKPPVRSVFELAALITDRCTGTFDRHQWGNQDYLFLEMFELSIGTLTRRETALFERFQRDSSLAAQWLKRNERSPFYEPKVIEGYDAEDVENEEDEWLKEDDSSENHARTNKFVDRLLNIAKEAKLLVECKDVQDELEILTTVLRQQKATLYDMELSFRHLEALSEKQRNELTAKLSQQQRFIDLQILDINRMEKQAKSVNSNLTQALDLKQKHANALEARFQRDQAQETARQGQTIMVFTIVTIIFLPMSFIASFFAINIIEFPHDSSNGGSGIHLGYVAKYMFGIGLGVSIPLIVIAFVFGDFKGWILSFKRLFSSRRDRVHPPHIESRPIEKHVAFTFDESRKSGESLTWHRPSRVDTDGSNRSRATHDYGMV